MKYTTGNGRGMKQKNGQSQINQMKQFLLIFRQGGRCLSQEEQKQRAGEVRAWALARVEHGCKLDPRILGEERCHLTPDGGDDSISPGREGAVVAITFLEASAFSEVVEMARTHPGP